MVVGKYLELAVILKAVDQMSGTVNQAVGNSSAAYKKLANSQERAQYHMNKGFTLGAGAFIAIDALKNLADKYGDVDAAQRQLKISEMKPGGSVNEAAFAQEMMLVKALSGAYGEHQAAYIDMIRVMKNYHLDDKDILGGTGKSVALLSKLFESDPKAGALFASRMKTDFRVNPDEMGKMVDMAVRLKQLNSGLSGEEMLKNLTDFSAGIALSSQNLGMKGAHDASELQILGAMYTAKGIDAPQVATTLRRIFENITKPERLHKMDEAAARYGKHLHFFDEKGNFQGIDNFVAQLGTLKDLKPAAVSQILGVLGSAQGMSGVMLKNIAKYGTDDFLDFKKNYADQGTPDQKLNEMMGGQTEQMKKAAVDLENLEVVLGHRYNPAVKEGAHLTQEFFKYLSDFADKHKIITDIVGSIVALGTATMVLGSAGHFMAAAWTSWGAGSIFRAIGSTQIWATATTAASDFAWGLMATVMPAVSAVAAAIAEIALPAGFLALLGYGLYETFFGNDGGVKYAADHKKRDSMWQSQGNNELEFLRLRHPNDWHERYRKEIAHTSEQFKNLPKISHDINQGRPDITSQISGRLKSMYQAPQKMQVTYAPVININNSGPLSKKTLSQTLNTHGSKVLELIEKQRHDHLRTAY